MPTIRHLLVFIILIFSATNSVAKETPILPYDQHISNSAPLYNIPRNNSRSKINKDKIITIVGSVQKVDCEAASKFLGLCSIIIDTFNIKREGFRYSYTRIYIPSDTSNKFKQSLRKKVIFKGVSSSMSLAKDHVNGERPYHIEFGNYKNCSIYLEN